MRETLPPSHQPQYGQLACSRREECLVAVRGAVTKVSAHLDCNGTNGKYRHQRNKVHSFLEVLWRT